MRRARYFFVAFYFRFDESHQLLATFAAGLLALADEQVAAFTDTLLIWRAGNDSVNYRFNFSSNQFHIVATPRVR